MSKTLKNYRKLERKILKSIFHDFLEHEGGYAMSVSFISKAFDSLRSLKGKDGYTVMCLPANMAEANLLSGFICRKINELFPEKELEYKCIPLNLREIEIQISSNYAYDPEDLYTLLRMKGICL